MTYESALRYLYERIDYERQVVVPYGEQQYKLDRMRELAQRLGRPDRCYPIIHVAGTKGKGSTATMIAAMLSAAGYRVGVYSSPHLDRPEERLAIGGRPCPQEVFAALVARVASAARPMDQAAKTEETGPTYFELLTAMAMQYFADCRADVAVFEVGMGGRLDSTNICDPVLSVITSISFDHMKQLGGTLAAIAREKAGIVKPGVPVVSGVTQPEPRAVIAEVCASSGSELLERERDFTFEFRPAPAGKGGARDRFDFHAIAANGRQLLNLELGMLGRHQAHNAAVAVAAIGCLEQARLPVDREAIYSGLAAASIPARVEIIGDDPAVVIDAAHNAASAAALVETLDQRFANRRRLLVLGTSIDKDIAGILEQLIPAFDRVLFTRYSSNPRGMPAEALARLSRERWPERAPLVTADAREAWHVVEREVQSGDVVCVTGSFFLAAELRQWVLDRPLTPLRSSPELPLETHVGAASVPGP